MTTPVRYGSRYGSPPLQDARACWVCGTPVGTARAHYCSPGCKQRAYRLRHEGAPAGDLGAVAADLKRRQRLVAQTIYECPECGERSRSRRTTTSASSTSPAASSSTDCGYF